MIHRKARRFGATAIPNNIIDDARLDFEDLGALVYLLSVEDGTVCPDDLVERVDGDRFYAIALVDDLRALGYLEDDDDPGR